MARAARPFFCSGCPHNSSTKAPEGTLVGAGIGCHTMVLLNPEGKGEITGITQMGGEGAQWIGMAPFTDDRHLVQNIGDGTFHHSGSLAVRAAVAAGVNITYKLLFNGAVAMTGGQDVEGGMSVPELTRWLELEGVRRIIVTTEEPERYRGVKLAPIAELRDRDELLEAQRELAEVDGVTVLIHDQECAAELRRKRKRGKAPEPAERIWINERVCEGCGDCGKKSSCLSVLPGGDRVRPQDADPPGLLQQGLLVRRGRLPVVPDRGARARRRARRRPAPPAALPEPERVVSDAECGVRMMGIGGTGVVTVSQVLGMAALIDGLHVRGLDQTGLSQKGGPVVSDLRISRGALASAQQGSGRQRGRLPRLRPARRRRRLEPRHAPTPTRTVARRLHQRGAHRPDGHRPRRALPGAVRPARPHRRGHARASSTSTSTPRRSPSGCSATT